MPRSPRSPSAAPIAPVRGRKAKTVPTASQTPESVADIAEPGTQLEITPERVLREYARIAFADLRRIADWGPRGLVLKSPEDLNDADVAAISEIVTGSGSPRVKLYDKKAALDALARHLGLFVPLPQRREEGTSLDLAEDAREVLSRRLARLAAGGAEE